MFVPDTIFALSYERAFCDGETDRLPRAHTFEAAKAMLAHPDIGVTQIVHRLGVCLATLYRYIPAARTANTPDV